jgi:hypothetical protein
MTTTTPTLPNITIVASKRYIIVGDELFTVQALHPDGTKADIVNAATSVNAQGKYMISFETIADASLYINGVEVTLC